MKMEEWIEEQHRIIALLKKKFPKQFLTVFYIYVKPVGELIPVGVFACRECNKPISHMQFAFSGLCGDCDVGRPSPKWKIVKPEIKKVVLE